MISWCQRCEFILKKDFFNGKSGGKLCWVGQFCSLASKFVFILKNQWTRRVKTHLHCNCYSNLPGVVEFQELELEMLKTKFRITYSLIFVSIFPSLLLGDFKKNLRVFCCNKFYSFILKVSKTSNLYFPFSLFTWKKNLDVGTCVLFSCGSWVKSSFL